MTYAENYQEANEAFHAFVSCSLRYWYRR